MHTDIAVRQFVKINGIFQLNDFNFAKLVYQNSETGDLCPQYMGKAKDKVSVYIIRVHNLQLHEFFLMIIMNNKKNRSPEEMLLLDRNEVTEMMDGELQYVEAFESFGRH